MNKRIEERVRHPAHGYALPLTVAMAGNQNGAKRGSCREPKRTKRRSEHGDGEPRRSSGRAWNVKKSRRTGDFGDGGEPKRSICCGFQVSKRTSPAQVMPCGGTTTEQTALCAGSPESKRTNSAVCEGTNTHHAKGCTSRVFNRDHHKKEPRQGLVLDGLRQFGAGQARRACAQRASAGARPHRPYGHQGLCGRVPARHGQTSRCRPRRTWPCAYWW